MMRFVDEGPMRVSEAGARITVDLTGYFGQLSHLLKKLNRTNALAIVSGTDHHHTVDFFADLYNNLVP